MKFQNFTLFIYLISCILFSILIEPKIVASGNFLASIPAPKSSKDSFIDFLKEYSINKLRACDTFEGESLVLIKTDNHDDFQTYFQQHLDELYAQIDAGNVGDGYTKEMAYDDLFHGIIESIVYPRDKVYSDKSLYNEALEEAERRKSENMKKLYSYQILKS